MSESGNDDLYARPARSALRHRPIFAGAAAMTDQPQPRVQRASRMRNTTTDETRQSQVTQAKQATQGPQKEVSEASRRTSNQSSAKTQPQSIPPFEESKRHSPRLKRFKSIPRRTRILALFIASIAVTLLIVFLYQQIASLVTVTLDDLHYGRPPTFQVDAFVGHETGKTPSHFIALNLHGHIEIIEMTGGDPTHIHEYSGPQLVGPNADLIPSTLHFVNTTKNLIKDMILQAGNVEVYYHNVQGTFRSS